MDVWQKLNLKDQAKILVVDAPDSFEQHIEALEQAVVLRSWGKVKEIDFVLAFVTKITEIEQHVAMLNKKTEGDAVVWFAYPKQTSKNLKCEFNRDNGWDSVNAAGFKGVRQIAIDDDWSALRFRRREYVKVQN